MKRSYRFACAAAITGLFVAHAQTTTPTNQPMNIVTGVQPGPLGPGGNITGGPLNLIVNLTGSQDPAIPGRSLNRNQTIRITLPEGFSLGRGATFTRFGTGACRFPLAEDTTCNTVVLMSGTPDSTISPSSYEVTLEGGNTIVIRATEDIVAGPNSPGIKQVHLLLNTVDNPAPGMYLFNITSATGANNANETGQATVQITGRGRPTILATSQFASPAGADATFQTVLPGNEIPRTFDVLLWNGRGQGLQGVTLEPNGDADADFPTWVLRQGNRAVGFCWVDGPANATGIRLAAAPSSPVTWSVTGQQAALLRIFFRAGTTVGNYALECQMIGGNSVRMNVRAANQLTQTGSGSAGQ
ncbi:MAG: hypothetical protein K2X35_25680 [Bryobacteraceae bacterium]|nr:hypothetical protein [Bryobacteraceae bacterium]